MTILTAPVTVDTERSGVPLHRLVKVEVRKMFDTRSGFWLMASIGILALLATILVILLASDADLTYDSFAASIGVPMTIILPIIAILSVTGEWTQRTGLITFTLVPHRARVVGAKAIASVLVGALAIPLAFAIGAVGNIVGSAIAGVDTVWDLGFESLAFIILANVLGLLVGFMLGILIRNSAGAIVAYFVYSFVLPSLFELLASRQDWFNDLQPWVDFKFAQSELFDGSLSPEQWANIGTSGVVWLAVPLAIGVWSVLRAEVK